MRMKLYGHMNENDNNRKPSIYRRIITRLRPPKPKPKPKLQNLPKELLEEIAKKLKRNVNVQSLAIALPQTRSVFLDRKEKLKKLRALERRLYSNERIHGFVGKGFKEVLNQMKLVDPNHNITVSAETNLISAKNLLSKLKYSHPNTAQNGRNIYKEMIRRKVYRRGKLVYRTLPRYYVFNTRHGRLSHMNVSGPRRHNPIYRTRMRNVKSVGTGRNRRLVLNLNNNTANIPTISRNVQWVGPFANTSNQYRHFTSKNGKYKYYPNSNTLKINGKVYTNAKSKFNHLPRV